MQWKIQVIRCPHRVPSVGYCVSDVRKTLKPEYKGLSQKEIGQLKKSGVEIVETTEFRLFAFMGDTTPELFELHPEVFGFPTIFVECTFWDHREDDHLEAQAAKTTHIHWNKLKPVIQAHPECLFMLIHFTLRYDETQIAEFFKRESEQNQLYNFALWLDAGVLEFKPPSQNTE
jgi:ribonuclease Z